MRAKPMLWMTLGALLATAVTLAAVSWTGEEDGSPQPGVAEAPAPEQAPPDGALAGNAAGGGAAAEQEAAEIEPEKPSARAAMPTAYGGGGQNPHQENGKAPAGESVLPLPQPADLDTARALQAKGDLESWWQARAMYTELLRRGGLSPEVRGTIVEAVDVLNERLFFSPEPCPGSHQVVVKPGDTLGAIARREGQSVGVIMTTNYIRDPNRIRVGERLKIVEGEITLEVDKEALRLTVLCGGALVREYPIGIGKHGKTPSGEYTVAVRLVEPDWYPPEGGVIRYGDPDHAIGTRWLGFARTRQISGLGIHGTNAPETVPGRESAGCIRLRNEDVEELFPLVAEETRVLIR